MAVVVCLMLLVPDELLTKITINSIKDVAEDSDAKYFLAMLKCHCNPADREAMALLQEISGGPSPPDGRWKNHNQQWLCNLIKQDLDNIAWRSWLDDGDDDDIQLLPV
jgi:hypothetical protein